MYILWLSVALYHENHEGGSGVLAIKISKLKYIV